MKKSEKLKELEILRKIWKDLKIEKKNDKFNNKTSAMFNAYLISTLKYEKNKIFLSNSKNLKK